MGVLTILLVSYLVYCLVAPPSPPPRRAIRKRRRVCVEEGFDGPAATPAPPPVAVSRQEALDFSDVFVSEEDRQQAAVAVADQSQMQSVNDRFEAAKRKVTEHKLKTGVYTNEQRRKLVDTLLRRPHCTRRVRSWRTENSDILRGDPRPAKSLVSTNVLRSAKGNEQVDLHPGALGPMSGLGRWLSEENLPGNLVPEGDVYER